MHQTGLHKLELISNILTASVDVLSKKAIAQPDVTLNNPSRRVLVVDESSDEDKAYSLGSGKQDTMMIDQF